MENNISGKVIVITGASSGAGRSTALRLALDKTSLVLAARNLPVLEELAKECRELGSDVLVIQTDVTDHEAVQQLARKAFEWKGMIDVWVNNAGVLAAGPFETMPWEAHKQVISTNLLGYMAGAYAVLPYFKQQKSGIIINNISIGAYLPVPLGGAYTASKFALRGFFESLKGELSGWPNIHIVDLFSAFLDTPGIQHAGNYTGKVLKPAPPVFDPRLIADTVRASIISPKSTRYPDKVSLLFKLGHALAPELTVKLTSMLMKGYFNLAEPAAETSGNLFNTVEFSMSTNGNSRPRLKPASSRLLAATGVLAGVAIIGYYLMKRPKANM